MTTPTDQELEKVARALEVYARRYDKDGKVWNWRQSVCDSYSGEVSHFDWHGDEQDEPWEVAEAAISALKQVQPTKPLVDSIAVSPQEEVPASPQNVSTDVRETSEDSSDGPHYNFWMFGRGTRCGICYWALYDGDWCMNKDCVMWQKSVQDNRIYLTNEEAQILIDRRVPPPATTPANP